MGQAREARPNALSETGKTPHEWLSYHHLVGKHVVDAGGKSVGRVADLRAEARGDAFCVTALLVGPASMLRRLGFVWSLFVSDQCGDVPWDAITHVDDCIHLRMSKSELELPFR